VTTGHGTFMLAMARIAEYSLVEQCQFAALPERRLPCSACQRRCRRRRRYSFISSAVPLTRSGLRDRHTVVRAADSSAVAVAKLGPFGMREKGRWRCRAGTRLKLATTAHGSEPSPSMAPTARHVPGDAHRNGCRGSRRGQQRQVTVTDRGGRQLPDARSAGHHQRPVTGHLGHVPQRSELRAGPAAVGTSQAARVGNDCVRQDRATQKAPFGNAPQPWLVIRP